MRFVAVAILIVAVALGVQTTSRADDGPVLPKFIFTPAPRSTTPETLEEIARIRVTLCADERKAAESALTQAVKSDAILVGFMHKLGDTSFTLDDVVSTQLKSYGSPTLVSAAQNGKLDTPANRQAPTVVPTPVPIEVANEAGLPYWTGSRRLLDASGDLEKSVRSSAAAVDKLNDLAKRDPDPVRRAAIQQYARSLIPSIIAQAEMIGKMTQFVIRSDTSLSFGDLNAATSLIRASNGGDQVSTSPFSSNQAIGAKQVILKESSSAHQSAITGVTSADEAKRRAFARCAP